jgi:hypothetical protein
MIGVYALFLYNLASSVCIMRIVDAKKPEDALRIRGTAIKFLPVKVSCNRSSNNCALK